MNPDAIDKRRLRDANTHQAPPHLAPPNRDVPSNDHVWDDLQTLAHQLHAFKQRIAERHAAFLRGADELREAEERCDKLLRELAEVHP